MASMIKDHKPKILILMKTHITGERAEEVSESLGFNSVARVDPNGLSGGIWVLWNRDTIDIAVNELHPQFIQFDVLENGQTQWACHAVYASLNVVPRKSLWKKLLEFSQFNTLPWFICGDLNHYGSIEEKKGGRFSFNRTRIFRDSMKACNLIYLGFKGNPFTWVRMIGGKRFMQTRLDRALSNEDWRLLFP